MGLLRLLLAFSVVSGHSHYAGELHFFQPFFLINASAAVACFFVISGFYMALVLNEKYASRTEFFVQRLLRLYPAYIVLTVIAIAVQGFNPDPLGMLVTLTLIGQDVFAISVQAKGLDPLSFVPVAQAWSVAVELELYVVAALMFSRRNGILTVLAGGIFLRIAMQLAGFVVPVYGLMFIFNVLVFFALGGAAYLAYRMIKDWSVELRSLIAATALVGLACYCYAFDGFWNLEARGADWRFYPLYFGIAVLTPFLFSLTKNSKLDRFFGDLSYPVYLCHILVFSIAKSLSMSPQLTTYFVLFVTLIVAAAVYFLVERPIDRFRHSFGLSRPDSEREVAPEIQTVR